MDKADWAVVIAICSACFTGWQAWSGHVSARTAKAAQKRKAPIFEVAPIDDQSGEQWVSVWVTARNNEPASVEIFAIEYRGKGVVLLDPSTLKYEGPEYNRGNPIFEGETGSKKIPFKWGIGAGGAQSPRSTAPHVRRPTEFFHIYAMGTNIDRDRFRFHWRWRDGASS